jgi:heat shock protein HslJ
VADFKKQQPYLEINAKEKTFMGSGGCNAINGKLFSEDTLLRFTNVISTRMMCPASNIETDFLKALQSTTTFKIENNSLILTNPNDVKLVFKKGD